MSPKYRISAINGSFLVLMLTEVLPPLGCHKVQCWSHFTLSYHWDEFWIRCCCVWISGSSHWKKEGGEILLFQQFRIKKKNMFNSEFVIPWASTLPSSRVLWERETRAAAVSGVINALQEPNGSGITAGWKGLTWQIISPPAPPALAAQNSDLLMLLRSCPSPSCRAEAQRWWG